MTLIVNNLIVEEGLEAISFSATTIYSGSTPIESIFLTSGDVVSTTVSQGQNISVNQAGNDYEVSVVDSPSFNGLSASGTSNFTGTIQSGGTDLYSIFLTSADGNDITRVQPGTNITTGGTENNPTVNLIASPSVSNLTFSGTAIGGAVQAGDGTFTSLSATTLSGGTVFSGGTNLSDIFHQKNGYLLQKAGMVSGSTFSGNPDKATVVFSTNFPDNNYAISIVATVNRTWTIENKTLSGFTINSNANPGFASHQVYWTATEIGEGYR